jgi:hypothetical protein
LHQHYADDAQLYIALSASDPNSDITKLESCLTYLHSWFSDNGLCLSPSKSEAILFGTQERLHHFPYIPSINILGSLVSLSDKISTLGVALDLTLSFNSHVSNVCKTSYSHLQALKHICTILTKDIALSVADTLVQSHLDYATSILHHTSSHNIKNLQCVQTRAAWLVVIGNIQIPATDLLSHLHWLPVAKLTHFKIATLT